MEGVSDLTRPLLSSHCPSPWSPSGQLCSTSILGVHVLTKTVEGASGAMVGEVFSVCSHQEIEGQER